VADRGPTLRRRELGAALRDLRQSKGLTIEGVADEMLCSPTKISRIETAQRAASLRDVRDLCRIYGVDDARTDQLMRLTRESRQRGWWQEFNEVPPDLSTYIGLEGDAESIRTFESVFVPGLLQTEAYAEAVIRGNAFPEPDEALVAERVSVRMRRQERLTDENPTKFWAVIDEVVIRRSFGSPDVMREQLLKLVEMSRLRNVTLQVIPMSAGAYPGLEASAVTVLKFSETLTNVVYVEGILGNLFSEREAEAARISEIFDRLRAEALSPAGTRDLLESAAQALSER